MLTVRIDDVGASSKYYNQHGKLIFRHKDIPYFFFPLANFWFLKRIKPFRECAPYQEVTVDEWTRYLDLFERLAIKPIVAITASWVDEESRLIPFPEKFPDRAQLLKQASKVDRIEIANHGLTHCVVGNHMPSFWRSNQRYHREFWPYLDEGTHREHFTSAQKILEDYFEKSIRIFVPPGYIWSVKTYRALKDTTISAVHSRNYMFDSTESMSGISYRRDDQDDYLVLHDWDLKEHDCNWLETRIVDRLGQIG